jgi:hypothetical protein
MFGVVEKILSPLVMDCKVDEERSILIFEWLEAPSGTDSMNGQLGLKF